MKINSVGIEAYRQLTGDSQVNKKTVSSDSASKAEQSNRIAIPGQGKIPGSKLAVQLQKGNFIDMLSPEEKKALNLLFERFRAAELESGSYGKKSAADASHLGKIVDVKL
jgi:hypothetical protein